MKPKLFLLDPVEPTTPEVIDAARRVVHAHAEDAEVICEALGIDA